MDQEHYISYIREEANHEIARLKTLLWDLHITEEDREIALAMLAFYEDAKMVEKSFSPELGEDFVSPRTKRIVLRESDQPQPGSSPSSKKARAA